MDLKSTYDKIAELWNKDHEADTWWVQATDKFCSFLPAGGTILDVGCGSGIKTKYLVDRGFSVTAIDFSEKMVELTKQTVPEAKCMVMDMQDVSLLQQEFDGIFAQASLLHLPKMEVGVVLARLAEKLKPGGYFYVGVKGIRPDQPEEAVITEDDYGFSYERFFSFYTLDEMKHYFTALDLTICFENELSPGSTTWVQIIGKKTA